MQDYAALEILSRELATVAAVARGIAQGKLTYPQADAILTTSNRQVAVVRSHFGGKSK
jgi:hypothetical protein